MTTLVSSATRTLLAGLSALALGAALTPAPARADPGVVIAGAIGAAAVAAIVAGAANAHAQPTYYGYAEPTFAPPAPVYGAPDYGPAQTYRPPPRRRGWDDGAGYAFDDGDDYAPECRIRHRPVRDEWGRVVGYRPARVCR